MLRKHVGEYRLSFVVNRLECMNSILYLTEHDMDENNFGIYAHNFEVLSINVPTSVFMSIYFC